MLCQVTEFSLQQMRGIGHDHLWLQTIITHTHLLHKNRSIAINHAAGDIYELYEFDYTMKGAYTPYISKYFRMRI